MLKLEQKRNNRAIYTRLLTSTNRTSCSDNDLRHLVLTILETETQSDRPKCRGTEVTS